MLRGDQLPCKKPQGQHCGQHCAQSGTSLPEEEPRCTARLTIHPEGGARGMSWASAWAASNCAGWMGIAQPRMTEAHAPTDVKRFMAAVKRLMAADSVGCSAQLERWSCQVHDQNIHLQTGAASDHVLRATTMSACTASKANRQPQQLDPDMLTARCDQVF